MVHRSTKRGVFTMIMPYFLENEEWYRFDEVNWRYVLTDKAPQEAVDSYNEYYDGLKPDKDGYICRP